MTVRTNDFSNKKQGANFFPAKPNLRKNFRPYLATNKSEAKVSFLLRPFLFRSFSFRHFLFRSSFRQPSTFSFAFFPVPPDSGKPRIPTMVLKMYYCLYLVCIENQLETWWQDAVKNIARLFRTVSGGKECCKCSRLVP